MCVLTYIHYAHAYTFWPGFVGIDPDIAYHVELHRMTCSGYLVKLGGT